VVAMTDDRLYVDIGALSQGGVNMEQWASLARAIANQMQDATGFYRFAGGTGEMGEKFNENYKPGEVKALQFLALLEKVVGGAATRTRDVAKNFDQTNDEATYNTPNT
jgi:hypothetical protein